ncbi:hypothetical protein PV10_08841 [Exophiala mesophila]|uniref:Transcription factor TFIIIB component B'' Myb domain-containing protein n=1 Tax=Exophiala mesophila TaxID=212818 RepID=A0A0D1Z3C7_EXOME|nr:uncharacterized protein PV10_08841 [Exophiala mesophila]KIV89262.1 hypothetical protein PV10_08841 [Exophiala mesophila]
MSTFSSVVRKPGQKIVPKAAPRRNVTRPGTRPSAPPSLTPESHAPSPGFDVVEDAPTDEETYGVSAESNLDPPSIPLLSDPTPPDSTLRSSPDYHADIAPSISVEVYPPKRPGQGITIVPSSTYTDTDPQDIIPTITASKAPSTRSRPRITTEPTPAPSDNSLQDGEVDGETRSQEGPSKRRKTTEAHRDTSIQSQDSATLSENLTSILRSGPRFRRSESRTSDILLQDATSQAAAVSELANSIANNTQPLRSRRSATNAVDAEHDEGEDEEPTGTVKAARKKRTRKKALEDLANQVIDSDTGNRSRNSRKSTPENAESMKTDVRTSMSTLARDPPRMGKKSETEKLLQENWTEIKQRRKEDIERRREAAGRGRHGGRQEVAPSPATTALQVPKQIIVNGQIVVAAESREIAFGADVERAVIEDATAARDDDRIYRYVNQGTVGKHAGLRRGTKWDEDKTELFYKGLRWFGTDFGMIANFFPSFDRRQIKLKYMAELRVNGLRVKRCVDAQEPVDTDEYTKMTEHILLDPTALQAELDAEEKRLRDEDEQRRRDEGLIDNVEPDPADIALPTTEVDEDGNIVANVEGIPPTRRDQMSVTADQVTSNVVSKKKQQQPHAQPQSQHQTRRQTKESVGRGRQSKRVKHPIEGVEEQIGPVDEVGR